MVLDYQKLKEEFEEIKKREKKAKFSKKHLFEDDSLKNEENAAKENVDGDKQQQYWEYLMKNMA